MENLVDQKLFGGVYEGKKVLVTGHTGFKGSWLCYWLKAMGAEVCGYAQDPPTKKNHINLLNLDIKDVRGDIRDLDLLNKTFSEFKPDIVFHMAAQAIVLESYDNPDNTFETNVMGSLRVYEASRKCDSVKSIVTITTDKVYENNEWVWGYRETDRLGGKDPYSASKAAMEIMTRSYIYSFFNPEKFGTDHDVLVGTTRAGNVIGGGDWAEYRLIPDIVKASLRDEPVSIRSPYSTRPWQHVLEPLSGYLLLGQNLIERKKEYAQEYNFGPSVTEDITVEEVVVTLKKYWDAIEYKIERPKDARHEHNLLKLDCTKAFRELSWKPTWDAKDALKNSIIWYKEHYTNDDLNTATDIKNYIEAAKKKDLIWTK